MTVSSLTYRLSRWNRDVTCGQKGDPEISDMAKLRAHISLMGPLKGRFQPYLTSNTYVRCAIRKIEFAIKMIEVLMAVYNDKVSTDI